MATISSNAAEAERLIGETAVAWHRLVAPTILTTMRRECPVDLGLLQQQHRLDPITKLSASDYLVTIRALPYYGVYVHEGHGEIRPVRAKVLRFRTKGGALVFTKRVRPVAANPWMYRALRLCGFDARRVFK